MPIDPQIGAALIGGAASTVGSLFNVFGQKKANDANMELAKYQYEKNLEQWYRENEYNLPINQVARLRAAGINPVMAFSGGSTSGNVAAASPTFDRPTMDPYQVDTSGLASIASNYMASRMQNKQMELMDSQMSLNSAKAATENMVALLRELQGNNQWMQNQYFADVAPIMKEVLQANRDLIKSHKLYYDSASDNQSAQASLAPYRASQMLAAIRQMDANSQLAAARAVGQTLQNEFQAELRQYFPQMAKGKGESFVKLNNLRDVQKTIMEIQKSQMPLEMKLKVIDRITNALGVVVKGFDAGIPLMIP